MENNFTILINSCQKFSDMWNNVLFSFDKYWLNHPNIIILSDGLDENFKLDNVVEIKGEMSDRLLHALDLIKTKYVFLSFDDYYPCDDIDDEKIKLIVKTLEENDYDYCRIFDEVPIKGKKIGPLKYQVMPLEKTYEVNFYPSIWKVESFKKVIKSGETIWKAEARITRRAKEQGLKCICVKKNIFPHKDIVRKGKYLRSAYRFLKKNDLYISNRGVRTIKETVQLNTQIFVSNHTPKRLKEKIKAKLRKKGKVFYSDYAETDD